MNQSNLNDVIIFFENYGIINVFEKKANGKIIKTPTVEFNTIEFNLNTE